MKIDTTSVFKQLVLVAQLTAHWTSTLKVVSSIPTVVTNIFHHAHIAQ